MSIAFFSNSVYQNILICSLKLEIMFYKYVNEGWKINVLLYLQNQWLHCNKKGKFSLLQYTLYIDGWHELSLEEY